MNAAFLKKSFYCIDVQITICVFFNENLGRKINLMVRLGGRNLILGDRFSYISDLRHINAYILIFLKKFGGPRPPSAPMWFCH